MGRDESGALGTNRANLGTNRAREVPLNHALARPRHALTAALRDSLSVIDSQWPDGNCQPQPRREGGGIAAVLNVPLRSRVDHRPRRSPVRSTGGLRSTQLMVGRMRAVMGNATQSYDSRHSLRHSSACFAASVASSFPRRCRSSASLGENGSPSSRPCSKRFPLNGGMQPQRDEYSPSWQYPPPPHSSQSTAPSGMDWRNATESNMPGTPGVNVLQSEACCTQIDRPCKRFSSRVHHFPLEAI
jgi:hypothetical protein